MRSSRFGHEIDEVAQKPDGAEEHHQRVAANIARLKGSEDSTDLQREAAKAIHRTVDDLHVEVLPDRIGGVAAACRSGVDEGGIVAELVRRASAPRRPLREVPALATGQSFPVPEQAIVLVPLVLSEFIVMVPL